MPKIFHDPTKALRPPSEIVNEWSLTKIVIWVKNDLKLAHLSVAPKFYNILILLNDVWAFYSPQWFGKLLHIYQMRIERIYLWKFEVYSSWDELSSQYPVILGVRLPSPPKNFDKLHCFWSFLSCSSNYWKSYGSNLAHPSVASEFYISPVPLNEVWLRYLPKHFGKLFDINQLNIARHHLWKIGVCSS